MASVLAIDIGTTHAKILVINQEGEVQYASTQNYSTHHPQPGYVEQNPEEIYQAVIKLIAGCPDSIKNQVEGICFSSAMHSCMAITPAGEARSPLLIWSDSRSYRESLELRSDPFKLKELAGTGTPVHPMAPLCKIMWMKRSLPSIEKIMFIGIKEYIWFKWFGVLEVDQGVASATGLLRSGTLRWHENALTYAGIEASNLSLPVLVTHSRLLSNNQLLDELGFHKPVPCIIGSSDGCLAHLGSMIDDSQTISVTIGTSGAVRRISPTTVPDPDGTLFCYHLDDAVLIEGGATNNGGALLHWYSKSFSDENISESELIERAMSVSVGSDDLIFIPFIYGERTPVYDPDATGSWFGIKHHHQSAHFIRSMIEGIGFSLLSIAELLEKKSGPYTTVMASGGFIQSEKWVQLLADMFGKPFRVLSAQDASAKGAAMMGFRSLKKKLQWSVQPDRIFEPDRSNHQQYRRNYLRYKQMVHSLYPTAQ